MSDLHIVLAQDDGLPRRDDERDAQHEVLASLLAAYADGELPPETRSQLDAHLAGCARCRRELVAHSALHERLSREPVPAASASLRQRITTGIRAHPMPASTTDVAQPLRLGRDAVANVPRHTSRVGVRALPAILGAVAFVVASAAWLRSDRARPATLHAVASAHASPLVSSVFADYRRTIALDLPGRARDLDAVRAAVPFPVSPLASDRLRLLGAWTTSLAGGEPAAVLAYRWGDRVLLHYTVSEQFLFQSSAVREALAAQRPARLNDGPRHALAWAQPVAGSLFVGEVDGEELVAAFAAAVPRAAALSPSAGH